MARRSFRHSFTLRGFTLAELMVAILFICIALFGYISLHLRIIHSSLRLEEHEQVRITVEEQLVTMIMACRVQDHADGLYEIVSPLGGPLSYKTTEHWVHPTNGSKFQVLSADMIWHNDFGDHEFLVESAARRFSGSW